MEIPWEETDFAKDSQGDYDYLEKIYQWEATCGSDANDTEASYYPYDDGYDAGYVGTFIEEYLQKQGIHKTEPDGCVCKESLRDILRKYCYDFPR